MLASILSMLPVIATAAECQHNGCHFMYIVAASIAGVTVAVSFVPYVVNGGRFAVLALMASSTLGGLTYFAVANIAPRAPNTSGLALEALSPVCMMLVCAVALAIWRLQSIQKATEEDFHSRPRPGGAEENENAVLERDAVPEERYVVQSADPRYAAEAAEEAEITTAAKTSAAVAST